MWLFLQQLFVVYVCAGENLPFFSLFFFILGQISDLENPGLAQLSICFGRTL